LVLRMSYSRVPEARWNAFFFPLPSQVTNSNQRSFSNQL